MHKLILAHVQACCGHLQEVPLGGIEFGERPEVSASQGGSQADSVGSSGHRSPDASGPRHGLGILQAPCKAFTVSAGLSE